MTKSLRVFAAAWLVSALVYAQTEIAGKWTTGEQPDGSAVVVLQLSVKGSDAAGAVTIGENPTQPISEGKLEGNRLTFKTTTMLNGKEVPVSWNGEVRDNRLTLVRSFGTGGRKLPPIVMQRSK